MVIDVYGHNTHWSQLHSTFIMGVGQTSPKENTYVKFGNTVTTGTPRTYTLNTVVTDHDRVSLTNSNLPSHTHQFKATNCPFTLEWALHAEGPKYFPYERPHHINTHTVHTANSKGYFSVQKSPGTLKNGTMSLTFKGSGALKTSDFTKDNHILSGIYSETGQERKEENFIKHNNMPMFQTEYMWKRIS